MLGAAALLALIAACAGPAETPVARTSAAPQAPVSTASPPAAAVTELQGIGTPNPGTRYGVAAGGPAPFSFTVPRKDGVPGTWMYGTGSRGMTLGLRNSPQTGHAGTEFVLLDDVFDPTLEQPFLGKTSVVPAPSDAAGWEQWLRQTGSAVVTAREELEVDGVRLVRLRLDVADDIPAGPVQHPCMPEESCLALSLRGPALLGAVGGIPRAAELAVFELDGRSLVAATSGSAATVDQWLPLMHAVQESVRF